MPRNLYLCVLRGATLFLFSLKNYLKNIIFSNIHQNITCFWEHPHTMILAVFISQSDVKMPSFFFLLLAYYFMMSECSYTWCVVSMLTTL